LCLSALEALERVLQRHGGATLGGSRPEDDHESWGVATLEGTVESRRDKYYAEDLAEGILGAKDVQSNFRIKREQELFETNESEGPGKQTKPQSETGAATTGPGSGGSSFSSRPYRLR
jgi:hypothetical protein